MDKGKIRLLATSHVHLQPSIPNFITKYFPCFFFKKIKGFGGPQGQEDGGGNAISYKGVTVGITEIHENKALIINFIFSVSVQVHPRW